MLIPIDRPLIDGRNTREAATQTVSAGFVATHNQRSVLILTCDGADRVSGAPHIQAGARVGQELLILVTDDANRVTITDGGGAGTELNGDWVVADSQGIGAKLKVIWDGTRWWENDRKNGELVASGLNAYAEGNACTASNRGAHAEGHQSTASGNNGSHAEGYSALASGESSHAEGSNTSASGTGAHSEGIDVSASGTASHAEGHTTIASESSSHAEGGDTVANQAYTHAEGRRATANGAFSHAEGLDTTSSGSRSHAQGYYAVAGLYAEHAQAAGRFAVSGDAQRSVAVMRIATTDATLTETFMDGVDDLLTILDEYTYACKIMVVGRQDTGADHFMGTYHVLIQRTAAGAPALVGAVDIIYENNAGGWGAGGGLPVSILAGATNLEVWVEGLAAHNIRWVVTVEMARVGYAD